MFLKEYTLEELCEVDLSTVSIEGIEEEELAALVDLRNDLENHRWTCNNCEAVNFGDFTSGVEVDCEECGDLCQEFNESVYEVASWLCDVLEEREG